MATTGAKKAADKIEDIGTEISRVTGDNFGAVGRITPEGRLRAFGYGLNGPNVKVTGKLRNVKKNVEKAINKSTGV